MGRAAGVPSSISTRLPHLGKVEVPSKGYNSPVAGSMMRPPQVKVAFCSSSVELTK